MQKIYKFILSVIICFCASLQIVFADVYKEVKGTDLQIVKNGGWIPFQLQDKKTGKYIFPHDCYNMDYFTYKGKTVIHGSSKNLILYSPDLSFGNFLNDFYEENNKKHKIKFYNYPKTGAIRTGRYNRSNSTKANNSTDYSRVFVKDDYIKLENNTEHERTVIADSLISKILGISYYSNDNKSYKSYDIITIPGQIYEKITLKDNQLTVNYEGISEHEKIDLSEYENMESVTKKQQDQFAEEILKVNSLSEFYKYLSENTCFDFKNYPLTAAIEVNHKLILFENDKKRVKDIGYDSELHNISLKDTADKSVINRITGLNIWYGDINNIIYKKDVFAGRYGIFDKNLNIKVPAKYNNIHKIGGQPIEKCLNSGDLKTNRLKFKYEGQTKQEPYFIAIKCPEVKSNYYMHSGECGIYGVIGSNNEVIVPFEDYSYHNFQAAQDLDNMARKSIKQETAQSGKRDFLFIFVLICAFIMHLFGFA